MHSVWKSQKKSHSTLRAKRATFTFSKAARGRPEGPTERSVFKFFFVKLANFGWELVTWHGQKTDFKSLAAAANLPTFGAKIKFLKLERIDMQTEEILKCCRHFVDQFCKAITDLLQLLCYLKAMLFCMRSTWESPFSVTRQRTLDLWNCFKITLFSL